jgi:N-acetylmuramoyl-L-alanine amidase CwlA
VDDDSVTQSVPDKHVAWHCGGAAKHPYCRNENSLGVEICDDVRNGVIYPSAQTIVNALELVQFLMDKYDIPKANVIRHYDVVANNKKCPAYWVDDAKWKAEFWNKLKEPNTHMTYTITVSGSFTSLEEAQKALANLSILGFSGSITEKKDAPAVSKPVVPEKDTSIEDIAREVIAGKWGNGAARKQKLTAAGYDYAEVQAMVNKLLK